MKNNSDEAKLEEVKAILYNLQRIRPDLANAEPPSDTEASVRRPEPSGKPETFSQRYDKAGPALGGLKRDLAAPSSQKAAFLWVGAALAIAGASAAFFFAPPFQQQEQEAKIANHQPAHIVARPAPDRDNPATSAPIAVTNAEDKTSSTVLDQAGQLMVKGDILGARETLMGFADEGSPEIALALARSYDPNFLRSIANPNASADRDQAEQWYRRWHEKAVKEGLVTDRLPLERIIRAMR